MSPGADLSIARTIEMVDTFDRPGSATATGVYAGAGTYAEEGFTNKAMQRIPKAGAYAGAGVGRAGAEFSVFEAEANGPNASAGAQASLSHGVSAMARAELASASATAGPVKVQAGLGVDTGVSAGPDGVEVQLLGTGVRLGPSPKLSVLGSSVECSVM
ncbi:hypothetical protein ANANG_G00200980 [Anguilla anguilla]|uniref:Uncharacterized protein n=1 Tax=Anguilla anguilla TaxID=7936 RepID=A0A9D3M036_ANGAN|nr:hypothetical protein ANANG_G00200980 [Anguilla anguilla]